MINDQPADNDENGTCMRFERGTVIWTVKDVVKCLMNDVPGYPVHVPRENELKEAKIDFLYNLCKSERKQILKSSPTFTT